MGASPARIYGKLRLEYARMDVPVSLDDSLTGMIGNLRLLRVRKLAGVQLSRSISCGGGISGPLADDSRVQLALVSMVKPVSADSSDVRT